MMPMELTLTIDPTDDGDLDRTEAVVAALRQLHRTMDDATPTDASTDRSLDAVIEKIANPAKYGENRVGYLRLVATAGIEGVAISELLETHFGASHNKFGGTHSSIERSWKALGGPRWTDQLISETPDSRHVMFAPAIPLVLGLVDGAPTG